LRYAKRIAALEKKVVSAELEREQDDFQRFQSTDPWAISQLSAMYDRLNVKYPYGLPRRNGRELFLAQDDDFMCTYLRLQRAFKMQRGIEPEEDNRTKWGCLTMSNGDNAVGLRISMVALGRLIAGEFGEEEVTLVSPEFFRENGQWAYYSRLQFEGDANNAERVYSVEPLGLQSGTMLRLRVVGEAKLEE
jgi:hypothetical protein